MAKRKEWRDDKDWWNAIHKTYAIRGQPTRWARKLRMDKGSLSKKVRDRMLNTDEALAISRLLHMAPPRGLLDELYRRAIAALEHVRKAGGTEREVAEMVRRLEAACGGLASAVEPWESARPSPPQSSVARSSGR